MTQLYRPDRDVIDAVDNAEWLHIEDAMTATDKALDDALWDGDGDLAEILKRELEWLRAAHRQGEQYDTSW